MKHYFSLHSADGVYFDSETDSQCRVALGIEATAILVLTVIGYCIYKNGEL